MSRLFAFASTVVTAAVVGAATCTGLAFATSTAVTFDGSSLLGLPLLSCASKPDTATVFVQAGDSVEVRNLTGHPATIFVNGAKAANNSYLALQSAAPVTFPAGTWSVALVPSCLLNVDEAGAVTVHVSPRPQPTLKQLPPPTPTQAVEPTPPANLTQPSNPPARPSQRPTATSPGKPTKAPDPRLTATTGSALGGLGAPTIHEPRYDDPTDQSASVAGSEDAIDGIPDDGIPDGGIPDGGIPDAITSVDATNAGSDPGTVAIGSSVSLPINDTQGPSYLLVVLTTIGIIGVGAAGIRALIAQRAARRAY